MTFAELPRDKLVWLCAKVAADLSLACSVAAEQDQVLAVWCGVCRFDAPKRGRLGDVLAVWPMLARQEVPKIGQYYERAPGGVWYLREDMGRPRWIGEGPL